MSEVARAEIIKRSKGYLDVAEAVFLGTINALKHDISTFITRSGEASAHDGLKVSLAAPWLHSAAGTSVRRTRRFSALAKKLIDAGVDEELKDWERVPRTERRPKPGRSARRRSWEDLTRSMRMKKPIRSCR